jgi:hypothetical protein
MSADVFLHARCSGGPEAYERSTGLLWDHETAVGYETGANAPEDARRRSG